MRELKDILIDFNSKLTLDKKIEFFGLAHLQTKDDKTFPLINTGNGQGKKISIDDAFRIYHRLIDSETETDTSLGKGKFPYQNRIYSMRLVGLGNMRKIDPSYDTNDKIKNEVYDQIPVVLSQKEIITVTNENTNRNEVLGEEFDGFDLKRYNLDTVAFYIDYEIKQRVCPTKT